MLFITATPIGNLADITLRALETLRAVDGIICEDTRRTGKLLAHYEIKKPLYALHEQSREHVFEGLLKLLSEERNLALVTDSGTPGISDPGGRFVALVRERLPKCVITPIPGPSALTSLISICGHPADDFRFMGFLPHKKGRQTRLKEIAESEIPVVFYESPHRIVKTITELSELVSADREIVVARELTKMFETVLSGTVAEVNTQINASTPRGEYAIFLAPERKK